MKKHIYLFILIASIISACEGYLGVSGKVIDENGNPLSNVQIIAEGTGKRGGVIDTVYTDSNGFLIYQL